jgi:hypothetical protein
VCPRVGLDDLRESNKKGNLHLQGIETKSSVLCRPGRNTVSVRTAVSLADAAMISKIGGARNNNNNNNVFYFRLSPCFECGMFSFELFSGVWSLTF